MEQLLHLSQNLLGMSASVLMELFLTFLLPGLQSQSSRNKNWPFLSLYTVGSSAQGWPPGCSTSAETHPAVPFLILCTRMTKEEEEIQRYFGKGRKSPAVFPPAEGCFLLQRRHVTTFMNSLPYLCCEGLIVSTGGWAPKEDTCISRFSQVACYP